MDLIDREKLIRQIRLQANRSSLGETSCRELTFGEVAGLIMDAPTVDAEPVRHGHNENKEYHEMDEFICSECGLHLEDWTRYVYDEYSDEKYAQEYIFKRCPECGTKIGGAVIWI